MAQLWQMITFFDVSAERDSTPGPDMLALIYICKKNTAEFAENQTDRERVRYGGITAMQWCACGL